MEGLLAKIVENKKVELREERLKLPLKEMKSRLCDIEPPRDFYASVTPTDDKPLRLIAEIKKSSPLKGLLVEDLKVDDLAKIYEEAGASAISVLTERRFFSGDPGYIKKVKGVTRLPVLRKDFLIDEYQIYEA
ncbi:MAG TPA: indole-3-glycerol-phosphate synthase TrpC, partial [Nitrospiraceae bacterium]|nr:indole-3-glycerol-phosphate synthase TrpC [Nitrospiraceae bacterium]